MGALAALALVATALMVLALVVAAVGFAARGGRRRARRPAVAAFLLVVLYTLTLFGVSTTASPRGLSTGEWKCFDDWCVSLTSVVRTGDTVLVTLAVQNHGRRQQAPDGPRVWLMQDGRREEVVVPGLASPVAGGATRALARVRLSAPAGRGALLVVTEGGFPSALVIGDDNSPLHPQPGWPLE